MDTSNPKNSDYIFLLLVAFAVSLFYFTFTANNLVTGFTSDDAVYLLLADLYSFKQTTTPLLYDFIRQHSQFPPLYPLVLGVLGGDSGNPALAANITVLTLVFALLTGAIWAGQETGDRMITATTGILLFFLPASLVLAQELWSEFLFMIFLYATFILASRPQHTDRDWLAIAGLIALATLTRAAGLSLALAFCLVLFNKKVKSWPLYAAISLGPFLFWNLSRSIFGNSGGYAATVTTAFTKLTPGSMIEQLTAKLVSLSDSLLWLFTSSDTGSFHHAFSVVILLLLIVLALTGFAARIRLLRLDAIFVVLYLGMILIWPFGGVYYLSRFLFPLLPLLLLYAVLGIQQLGSKPGTTRLAFLSLSAALMIIAWPSSTQFIQRGFADIPDDLKPYTRDRTWLLTPDYDEAVGRARNTKFVLETLPLISKKIPETECLYAFQISMVMLHTKRVTGVLPPEETTDTEFRQQTRQCRFILAMPIQDGGGQFPVYYPIQRLPQAGYDVTIYYANPVERSGTRIFLFQRIIDTIEAG